MTTRDIKTRARLDMMADSGNLKGMSLSDYRICQFTLSEIIAKGNCKQLNRCVANFFKENGYNVSQNENGIYVIER